MRSALSPSVPSSTGPLENDCFKNIFRFRFNVNELEPYVKNLEQRTTLYFDWTKRVEQLFDEKKHKPRESARISPDLFFRTGPGGRAARTGPKETLSPYGSSSKVAEHPEVLPRGRGKGHADLVGEDEDKEGNENPKGRHAPRYGRSPRVIG